MPYVLSIAGYDPCGGAGVLSDCKTMEQHGVMGLAVTTCITYQNENEFEGVDWLSMEQLEKQVVPLFNCYRIDWVKIGLVKDLDMLIQILAMLKKLNPAIQIIWDTILRASAGFSFIQNPDKIKLQEILKELYLVTPNYDEIKILANQTDAMVAADQLAKHCSVLLKGGHSADAEAIDYLFSTNEQPIAFSSERLTGFEKHGSGCVLSAALISNLAKGKSLAESCAAAKNYLFNYLQSHPGKLGVHHT